MIREGTRVKWKWADGWGYGKVVQRYVEDVEKSIEGSPVKRNAAPDDPAYLIEQEDGGRVLKGVDEIERVD